jgi:hypothetical protein
MLKRKGPQDLFSERQRSVKWLSMPIRSALFWNITWRRVVIIYRRFGTTYQSHLQVHNLDLEDGNDTLSRNVGKTITKRRRVISQKSADVNNAAEA